MIQKGKISFEQDIEKDAFLIYWAYNYGPYAMMEAAFTRYRDDFSGGPDTVIERTDWLKKQPKKYIDAVSKRVVEIENEMEAK